MTSFDRELVHINALKNHLNMFTTCTLHPEAVLIHSSSLFILLDDVSELSNEMTTFLWFQIVVSSEILNIFGTLNSNHPKRIYHE